MYASGKYPDGFGEPKNPFAYKQPVRPQRGVGSVFGGRGGVTSAEAFMTVPVVAFPWMSPRFTDSEGLKYPAVKTHFPPWKADWESMSRT